METPGESRQRAAAKTPQNDATRRAAASASDTGNHSEGDGDYYNEEVGAPASNPSSCTVVTPGKRGRPIRQKAAKEDQRVAKQQEGAIRAQAQVTADMAAANFKKAQILQDQAALSLFTMPDDANLPELIELRREYLELRRQEELTNLRRRIALGNLEEAKQKAEAARVRRVNSDEVARVMRHWVPPPPMVAPTSPVTVPPSSPTGDVAPSRSSSPDCNSPSGDGHGDSEFHVARHVDVGGGRAG
jgi:hypothetical protein